MNIEQEQNLHNEKWKTPQKAKTLYYQGIFSSQVQSSKYLSKHVGFETTTGERVFCTHGMNAIHDVFIGEEIEEVRPAKVDPSQESWFELLQRHIANHKNKTFGVSVTDDSKNTEGTSLSEHYVNIHQVNLGQARDISNHIKKFQSLYQQHPKSPVILYGVSRGAATTFNAVCTEPRLYELSVKLIVLEGCFDSIDSVLNNYGLPNFAKNIVHYGAETLSEYLQNGPSPDKLYQDFPIDIPVAFVTSTMDEVVPVGNVLNICRLLIEKLNHPNVYLCQLDNACHTKMYEQGKDREKYKCFLHALYKKYDLPYLEKPAQRGEDRALVETAHLSLEKLNEIQQEYDNSDYLNHVGPLRYLRNWI